MIRHYRPKKVTVRALQYNGTPEGATRCIEQIADLARNNKKLERFLSNYGMPTVMGWDSDKGSGHSFTINTLEGKVAPRVNDYIVIGTYGEIYPVRADIFEEKYEFVPWEELREDDMWPEAQR